MHSMRANTRTAVPISHFTCRAEPDADACSMPAHLFVMLAHSLSDMTLRLGVFIAGVVPVLVLGGCAQMVKVAVPSVPRECTASNTIAVLRGVPTETVNGTLVATPPNTQAYRVTCLDLRSFKTQGQLTIDVSVGKGESAASFDLFSAATPLPTKGGPDGTLTGAYDVSPNRTITMSYAFKVGEVFKFGAEGNWFSRAGATNTYALRVLAR